MGGLVGVIEESQNKTNVYFPCFDGAGNIVEYIDDKGIIVTHYEYNPFGEHIVAVGDKRDDFGHRYSTRYFEDNVGLFYYGYRYYSSDLRR